MPIPTQYQKDLKDKSSFSNEDLSEGLYGRPELGVATPGEGHLNMPFNPNAQPGDPDFDWSTYDPRKHGAVRLLDQAKGTLSKADKLAQDSGLNRISGDAAAEREQNATEARSGYLQNLAETVPGQALGVAERLGSNILQPVIHPVDTLGSVVHAVTHPGDTSIGQFAQLAAEHPENVGPAFLQGLADPEQMQEAGGDFATTALMADPEAAASAAGNATTKLGRGLQRGGIKMQQVGRAAQELKTGIGSVPVIGALDYLLRKDPMGLAVATVPKATELAGKAVYGAGSAVRAVPKVVGGAVSGLKSALSNTADAYKAAAGFGEEVPVEKPADFAPKSSGSKTHGTKQAPTNTPESAAEYRDMVDNGFNPDVAARTQAGKDAAAQDVLKRMAYPRSQGQGGISPWTSKGGLPTEQDLSALGNNPKAISIDALKKAAVTGEPAVQANGLPRDLSKYQRLSKTEYAPHGTTHVKHQYIPLRDISEKDLQPLRGRGRDVGPSSLDALHELLGGKPRPRFPGGK